MRGRCNSNTGVGGVGVIMVMTGMGGVGVIATLVCKGVGVIVILVWEG